MGRWEFREVIAFLLQAVCSFLFLERVFESGGVVVCRVEVLLSCIYVYILDKLIFLFAKS